MKIEDLNNIICYLIENDYSIINNINSNINLPVFFYKNWYKLRIYYYIEILKNSMDNKIDEEEYYNSLSDIERTALRIAKIKLGSSFIPVKTLGYMIYIKELNEKREENR